MSRLISFLAFVALIICGKCEKTRVVFIDEIPIIIAGAPAPTNGVRGEPETYTPTLKSEEDDNVTLTVKDAQESNMTNVTPTVSAAIFLIILTHDKTRRRSESFYLLSCTFC